MAMNICPKCTQVTLTLGSDESCIQCPLCNTVYDNGDDKEEDKK